ncbi:MAG: endonuclease/exonuclease/phosphatase family protein [Sandaracinus sp.]|nr:endonuclease/exonuclease/phosphatase family protein [Sandaracinus sp.]
MNLWFHPHFREERARWVVDALEAWDADVVVLQEVTTEVLGLLLRSDLVREEYDVLRGSMDHDYAVVVLTRLPFAQSWELPLPSMMGRTAVTGLWRDGNESLVIAGVHLESTRALAATRTEQLALLASTFAAHATSLVVGDLNFDPRDPEERARDRRFVDVWPTVSAAPGYTEDTSRNTMRRRYHGDRDKQVRYDRALLRSEWFRGKRAALVGVDPITIDAHGTAVFPSDHFGVVFDFERR